MGRRISSLIIIFFGVAWNIPAQNPGIRHYTTYEGLAGNEVYHVYQDSRKFIWFATDAGAVRFDGSQFRVFTKKEGLNSNSIRKFKEDSSGRLWITNRNGSLNFILNNKIYNSSSAPFLDSLKPVEPFHDFFEDDDHTLYFYNLTWEAMALDKNNRVRKFEKVHDRLLNTYTWNEVINLYLIRKNSNGEYLAWTRHSILKFRKLFDNPVLVYSQKDFFRRASAEWDGYFYIVAKESLIYRYRDERLVDSIPVPVKIGYGIGSNNYLLLDADGNFWVRTFNHGVFCFRGNRVVRHFDIRQVNMIIQDNEKNIWISSTAEGVYKISSNLTSYIHYEKDLFQLLGVKSMDINPAGGIWLTNGQSVFLLKNKEIYTLEFDRGKVTFNDIRHLGRDQLIVGQRGSDYFAVQGLSADPRSKRILYKSVKSSADDVSYIAGLSVSRNEDKMNTFHYFSFFCLDPGRLFKYDQWEHNVGSRIFSTFYNCKDELVINAGKNYFLEGEVVKPAKELSLFDGRIITQHLVLNDSVELFVIENEGLYLSDNGKIHDLSSSLDLPDRPDIRYIAWDDPVLYLATNGYVLACENPMNACRKQPIHLRYLDIPFRNIKSVLANNDSLYVGSDDGLTVIPESLLNIRNDFSPSPYMESIFVNDKPADLSVKAIIVTGKNQIKFIFGSVNFSSSPVIYSYKLEGADKNWSTGTDRTIIYQDLPKGNYVFKIKAGKPFSPWSMPVEYRVEVHAPFWQHPFFYTALILVAGALVALAVIRRKNLQIRQQEIENQLVTLEQKALQSMMNPHFIFNSLGSIQNYLLQEKTGEAGLYLSQFARLIRQNINAINSALINLDEETDRLKNYLELEKLRLVDKFDYRISLDEEIETDEVFLPSMIIQPFVENAIWHGITPLEEKGMVTVHFRKESERSLMVIVEDNGIGMKQSEVYSTKNRNRLRLSLELTRKRLELLGKKHHVETRMEFTEAFPGKQNPGTRVVLVVPFLYDNSIS